MPQKESLPRIPTEDDFTPTALKQRNQFASHYAGVDLSTLTEGSGDIAAYKQNIENIFGFAHIPIGLSGPMLLNGDHAQGKFLVPLATTEGTLVASYSRGMKAISLAGGAKVQVTQNEISSSVTFLTASQESAQKLQQWITDNHPLITQIVATTTKHGRYIRSDCTLFGSRLIVDFMYDPADAMGINMITNASFAVANTIVQQEFVEGFFFPSALQGDKKASFYSFHRGRGRSVTASVLLPAEVLEQTLKTSADAIYRYHQNNMETAHLVGGYGFNMHIGNGIVALGLATGQDVAYVGESANGLLIIEKQGDNLFFSLRIPSLYVGTVGGGTGLPTAKPCLELLGCTGPGSVLKLAEIFAGTCLAGEISVLAAISSQTFVAAHNALGRNRPSE